MTLAQSLVDVVVVAEHLLALVASRQDGFQFLTDILHAEGLCHQLAHHLAVGYQIHQRHVFHLQHVTFQKTDQLAERRLIAHHLRHTEHAGLQRCRTTGHQRGSSPRQQGVSLVHHEPHLTACQERLVVVGLYRGRSGQHQVIAVGQMARGLNHRRQVVLDFLLPTTRQQGDDTTPLRLPRGGVT